MKTFTVTYDLDKYKPSSFDEVQRRKAFSLSITAYSEADAASILRNEHNFNPFYFKFIEVV